MHTHLLTIDGDVVRKQYVSWTDGEADREWAGLTALARHAPGLAPAPISREVCGDAPVVVMSRVPGVALGSIPLSACEDSSLVRDALDLARSWLATDDPEVDRVTDPVLALGDGDLANVLWDGGTCRFVDFEEFGTSDLAYEVADLVEHASSRLGRLLDVQVLLEQLRLDEDQQARLREFRRVLATFWLVMLLPGNRGFDRNPAGSAEDQSRHVLALLAG